MSRSSAFLLAFLAAMSPAAVVAPAPYVPSTAGNVANYGGGGSNLPVSPVVCVGITALVVGVGIGIGFGALIFDRPWGSYGRRGVVVGGGVWYGKRRRRKRGTTTADEDEKEVEVERQLEEAMLKYA